MKITDTVQSELDLVKQKQKKKLESETGVRYSVILGLPYYYAIRLVLIDLIHNLFLGKKIRNFLSHKF